ncbi:MAG: hypothetical protein MJY69_00990 [Bacteroidales bacterium]|nr:hypothetical protein [Bacteroidales bacterium]
MTQDLMKLASRLDMNLLVMHYPTYCSKYNPVEHRLFSQITLQMERCSAAFRKGCRRQDR